MNKMEYGYIRNTKTKHGHFFHKIITSNTTFVFVPAHYTQSVVQRRPIRGPVVEPHLERREELDADV